MNLDFNEKDFKQLYELTGSILQEWHEKIRNHKIYHNESSSTIFNHFNEKMPEKGMEPADVLATIKRDVFRFSNYNPSPNYYGYITGGGNQMAILAETLRTALNQNNLKLSLIHI